ncbi:hypothetical protein EOL96_02265 [Candidatus Saccharibacteria bacterium]|nr:hypothetical protein [Candidatus Saccharibacteria bacterium]
MGKAPSREATPTAPASNRSTPILLVASIADTTWRMFVPTIGLLLLGRAADDTWGLGHLGMAVGTIVGAAIAALLIKRQLEMKV